MNLNYIFLENKNYYNVNNDSYNDLISILMDQQQNYELVYLLI